MTPGFLCIAFNDRRYNNDIFTIWALVAMKYHYNAGGIAEGFRINQALE